MPLIWCAISGHGYGHAAQVVPVLNALGVLVPGLTAVLRTTVPSSFFRDRLTIPWDLQPVQQDVGCIQDGPLKIDIDATWRPTSASTKPGKHAYPTKSPPCRRHHPH